ncbi:DUF397 domain-containing protein [Streptomyces sp. SID3343]|nr:DUF397 domain-containing protein [Streptomyces sp. SID3343]
MCPLGALRTGCGGNRGNPWLAPPSSPRHPFPFSLSLPLSLRGAVSAACSGRGQGSRCRWPSRRVSPRATRNPRTPSESQPSSSPEREVRDVPAAEWRKSSFSGQNGAGCVSIATTPQGLGIRDSKRASDSP